MFTIWVALNELCDKMKIFTVQILFQLSQDVPQPFRSKFVFLLPKIPNSRRLSTSRMQEIIEREVRWQKSKAKIYAKEMCCHLWVSLVQQLSLSAMLLEFLLKQLKEKAKNSETVYNDNDFDLFSCLKCSIKWIDNEFWLNVFGYCCAAGSHGLWWRWMMIVNISFGWTTVNCLREEKETIMSK